MMKFKNALRRYGTVPAATGLMTVAMAFPAHAAGFDVTTELTTAFEGMASTMLGTISAVLPVVMSVMSAYICINFGIKFFRKFAK